jgi:hypothetical protein
MTKENGTHDSRFALLVLHTSLPSSSTLYLRNGKTRLWIGCGGGPLSTESRVSDNVGHTHILHKPRAGIASRRWKVDRWGELVV